ncbi:MAG: hypothetical protein ACLFM4_12515, partial [Phormidium sp.]
MTSGHQAQSKTDRDFAAEEAIQKGAKDVQKMQAEPKTATYRLTEKEVHKIAKVSEALRLNSE